MMEWLLNHESVQEFGTHCLRLFFAVLPGGSLGIERQLRGEWAGMGDFALAAAAGLISIVALALLRPMTKAIGREFQQAVTGESHE